MSRRLVPVTPPANESAPLLAELRQLRDRLQSLGLNPRTVDAAQRTRQRIADIQEELSQLAWQSDGSGEVAPPLGLRTVQEMAGAHGRQLVLLGRAGDELVVVLLGTGRARLLRWPGAHEALAMAARIRADLNVLARVPPEALARVIAASTARSLARLQQLLIDPLELRDGPVVIVPPADLSTIPWSLLPGLRGRPVEVAMTASGWCRGWQRAPAGLVRVLALAGPGLDAADREVGAVAEIWPDTTTLLGAAATGPALARAARSATVGHVAAHGTHVGQNPLFSSLRLAGGPLFAYELAAESIPEHVILSACELGQVTVRPGEESLGLTSVLLQLGARCVISGVAEVNDHVAADVMIDYHRRLAAGSDSAVALAAAVSAADSPAPFVCFGTAWSRPDPAAGQSPVSRDIRPASSQVDPHRTGA